MKVLLNFFLFLFLWISFGRFIEIENPVDIDHFSFHAIDNNAICPPGRWIECSTNVDDTSRCLERRMSDGLCCYVVPSSFKMRVNGNPPVSIPRWITTQFSMPASEYFSDSMFVSLHIDPILLSGRISGGYYLSDTKRFAVEMSVYDDGNVVVQCHYGIYDLYIGEDAGGSRKYYTQVGEFTVRSIATNIYDIPRISDFASNENGMWFREVLVSDEEDLTIGYVDYPEDPSQTIVVIDKIDGVQRHFFVSSNGDSPHQNNLRVLAASPLTTDFQPSANNYVNVNPQGEIVQSYVCGLPFFDFSEQEIVSETVNSIYRFDEELIARLSCGCSFRFRHSIRSIVGAAESWDCGACCDDKIGSKIGDANRFELTSFDSCLYGSAGTSSDVCLWGVNNVASIVSERQDSSVISLVDYFLLEEKSSHGNEISTIDGLHDFLSDRDRDLLSTSFRKVFGSSGSSSGFGARPGVMSVLAPNPMGEQYEEDLIAYNTVREVIGEFIVWNNVYRQEDDSFELEYDEFSATIAKEQQSHRRVKIGDVRFMTQPNRNVFMYISNPQTSSGILLTPPFFLAVMTILFWTVSFVILYCKCDSLL